MKSLSAMFAALALTGAAAMPVPLTGEFGGDQVRLSLGDAAGTLTLGCASATIAGVVRPDVHGHFVAHGRFETWQPGPQRADEGPGGSPARFDGHIDGTALTLTVTPDSGAAMTLRLTRDRRSKVIRCG